MNILDLLITTLRKSNSIIPMEASSSKEKSEIYVVIEGKGYSITINRNESYDEKQFSN